MNNSSVPSSLLIVVMGTSTAFSTCVFLTDCFGLKMSVNLSERSDFLAPGRSEDDEDFESLGIGRSILKWTR